MFTYGFTQVRDVTNLGLQFGNIGFDPSRKFGANSVNAPVDDSSAQHHAGAQTVPERSNAATSSTVPPPAAVEAFNAGGNPQAFQFAAACCLPQSLWHECLCMLWVPELST